MSVREATTADLPAVVEAVAALLRELGGRSPSQPEMEAEVGALLEDESVGTLLVAEEGGALVGVLGASWQRAIHVPGRYATIQDLWVDPEWRSRGVGAELVEALAAIARQKGVSRIEVGLPRETFAAIAQTTAFYEGAGFEHLGPRMRRLL
ncbi:MAG TPA: GNAT family N-acetyltransferase [Solirubrobacterales bacterium]|nr:GNAT family N-acetyltransferase [Solirubrobacterales bacterium]